MSLVSELKKYASMKNIAKEADIFKGEKGKAKLAKIGTRVLFGFNEDHTSCSEWLADIKKVEELASLAAKRKNFPLPNSANVKFPLISKAAFEFSSRTYPEIMKDGKVVKARVIGFDIDNKRKEKAERVSDYMNYQLLFEHDDWERDLDVLLTRVSLIGFVCKKSYYDPKRKRIMDEICNPRDLIINSDIKNLNDARRVSHIIHLRLNDLVESSRAGIFLKSTVDELVEEFCEDELDPKIDVIEQHTFLDLDDDDYSEPYIVTIVKNSGKILRIAPRFAKENIHGSDEVKYIDPIQSFTDFHFLVNPQGKFQSVGFGILMLHLNETINSILNMLLDAGQLANMQGGYKDSRLKNMGSGNSTFIPGELKTVKAMAGVTLKDGIFPMNFKEPSDVLFKLLGLLIQTGKDLSSSTEVMTGATSADNAKTGAVQALQAEGLKVFTSIQKRLYRSLTSEFNKLFDLNATYLDPEKYYNVLNDKKGIQRLDFNRKHVDVIPVADPNLSSELQRSQRNQILIAAQQLPGTDKIKLTRMVLDNSNLGVPTDEIMIPPEQLNKPDPTLIELQAKIHNMGEQNALKGHELMIREKEVQIEQYKVQCQCLELKSKALLEGAQASSLANADKFKEYELQLDILSKHLEALQHAAEFQQANQMHSNEMNMQQQQLDQQKQEAQQDAQAGSDSGVAGESSNS